MTTGGDGGIRTHDALLAHTPLAGEHLRPLGHVSVALILSQAKGLMEGTDCQFHVLVSNHHRDLDLAC